jgi:hypothetical protein
MIFPFGYVTKPAAALLGRVTYIRLVQAFYGPLEGRLGNDQLLCTYSYAGKLDYRGIVSG